MITPQERYVTPEMEDVELITESVILSGSNTESIEDDGEYGWD